MERHSVSVVHKNGGSAMRYAFMISAALLMGVGQGQQASAQSGPLDLVKQAVDALGGADALRAVKTIVQKADAKHWEPGQSNSVNGESRFLGDSTVTISVDYANKDGASVRFDWDRDMKYPAVEKVKYSEIRYPTYGAVIDDKGEAKPMSGIRLAANLREGGRGSPLLLLAALDSPQRVSAIEDQKLGNQTLPAVAYTEGPNKYIIIFDRTTKLPAAVRTRDEDNIYGDSNYDVVLRDWRAVAGVKTAGGANNLIVNMKDGLVVFDAPTDNGQSEAVIKLAKDKYPGKAIKYLVLTHHHMDHTGGMRAFAAEGATVIVPSPDKAYFEQVVKAAHSLEPDTQQKAMKPANVQEVKDQLSIKDDTEEITLYNIPNPHVDGMIIGHVAKANLLWVTDLISPRGPISRNEQTVAVGDALRKHNITGATIAGGHGTTAKQADIASALAAN